MNIVPPGQGIVVCDGAKVERVKGAKPLTDRQTDRQTIADQTKVKRVKGAEPLTDRQTDTDRQTGRQTDTDRQHQ